LNLKLALEEYFQNEFILYSLFIQKCAIIAILSVIIVINSLFRKEFFQNHYHFIIFSVFSLYKLIGLIGFSNQAIHIIWLIFIDNFWLDFSFQNHLLLCYLLYYQYFSLIIDSFRNSLAITIINIFNFSYYYLVLLLFSHFISNKNRNIILNFVEILTSWIFFNSSYSFFTSFSLPLFSNLDFYTSIFGSDFKVFFIY